MAKLWDLPCMFVCENNKYGMGTSAERSSSNTEYFTRGDKIPGIQANGMDVIASAQAVKYARDWVIAGKGPLLLEFVASHYGGHSCVFLLYKETNTNDKSRMADPGTTYRRCNVCIRRRTRSAVYSTILKNEAWPVAQTLR